MQKAQLLQLCAKWANAVLMVEFYFFDVHIYILMKMLTVIEVMSTFCRC